MSKIFEKILQDFKKANKAARDKMAAKFGFKTAAELEAHLGRTTLKVTKVTKKADKKPTVVEAVKEEAPTDMVIAFDTTGSMRSYIAAVRKHVEKTINDLFETVPNLRLKIVAFGDYCDMVRPQGEGPATEFGKAYQVIELTDDKAKLIQFVQDAKDTGGGDGDEFYELVLHRIINESTWRSEANKAILLIADCDPHEVGYTLSPWVKNAQYDWRKEARIAAEKNIKIDTLRIIPGTAWYAELSKITNGSCMDFRSSNKTAELVAGATYLSSRSTKGISKAKAMYAAAVSRGDDELIGSYKGMAASRGIDLDE